MPKTVQTQTKKSKKASQLRPKPKKEFFWAPWGYTKKDFKSWGKTGGRPAKYINDSERKTAYRRRKAHNKLLTTTGILSMKTGRISKYRTSAEKKRAYRLRKKLKETN